MLFCYLIASQQVYSSHLLSPALHSTTLIMTPRCVCLLYVPLCVCVNTVCGVCVCVQLTRDVVALRFNASGEVGVLRDGVAVVIQRREFSGDLRVARNQHRWQQ